MHMNNQKFEIKNENKEKALELLKKLARKNEDLSWPDNELLLASTTLGDALLKCCYEIEEDDNGNIFGIWFIGEKLGEDYEILNAIAPAVENGSYVQMVGEDGEFWRWIFKDGECKEISPKIIWKK